MIDVKIHAVLYSLLSKHRVVLLKEAVGERFLPIWIGMYEADAIALRLQGNVVPRPQTHDLLANLIRELDGRVQYVVVNDLRDNTFFARVAIEHNEGLQLVDSRPSDAIALAVRAMVPIYADESVLDKAGIVPSPGIALESVQGDEELDVFRDFVDTLDLDELGD